MVLHSCVLVSVFLFLLCGCFQFTTSFRILPHKVPTVFKLQQEFHSGDLEAMKLPELRALLKFRGGIPGMLGRSELIAQCRSLSIVPPPPPTQPADASAPTANAQSSSRKASRRAFKNNVNVSFSGTNFVAPLLIPIPDPVQTLDPPKKWRKRDSSQLSAFIQQKTDKETIQEAFREVEALAAGAGTRGVTSAGAFAAPAFGSSSDGGVDCDAPLWDQGTYRGQQPLHPIEGDRDKRLGNLPQPGEVDLTFLGTASCMPGITRGVTCVALRFNADVWLFDCGEGSQVQLKRSKVRVGRIKKIFITHTHGDHCFGLAGVLCMIGQGMISERDRLRTEGNTEGIEPVDIYGPEGIRSLIRSVMQLTHSRVTMPHRIHELKNVPYLHNDKGPSPSTVVTSFDPQFGERPGGRDIFPNSNGVYELLNENGRRVQAAAVQHSIPCVGYVTTEDDRPGALNMEAVFEAVKRNKVALREQFVAAQRNPMHIYQDLKAMKPDDVFTFPDGTQVRGNAVVQPTTKGRKIVFMGDTCNSERMIPLAQNCDVLIHEATNAYFPEDPGQKHLSPSLVEQETRSHGHSTPQMAGQFAAAVNARQLVLTHFSPRYPGDASLFSMQVMWRIEEMARKAWLSRVAQRKQRASRRRAELVAQQAISSSGGSTRDSMGNSAGVNSSGIAEESASCNSNSDRDSGGEAEEEAADTTIAADLEYDKNAVLAAWDLMSLQVDVQARLSGMAKEKTANVKLSE